MATSHTEYYIRDDGKWSWRRRAANGKITGCAGEGDGFASKRNAVRAWKAFKKGILDEG